MENVKVRRKRKAKRCILCGAIKTLDNFDYESRKTSPDGRTRQCSACRSMYDIDWQPKSKELPESNFEK